MKALALEFYKLRRKRILTMITLFLSAEMIWAFMSVSISLSRNPDSTSWEALFVTVASMNGLFLPVISAIIVSRVCDMEHKGNTLKLLISTAVKRNHLYIAKYVCINSLLFYYMVIQATTIAGFGIVKGFSEPLPVVLLFQFIAGAVLTNLAVVALQQWVSLSVKNQAFALCLGMMGGFIGMTADFFPAAARQIFIWSYYTELSPVTFLYTNQAAEYILRPLEVGALATVLLMTTIFYMAGSFHVSRQEV